VFTTIEIKNLPYLEHVRATRQWRASPGVVFMESPKAYFHNTGIITISMEKSITHLQRFAIAVVIELIGVIQSLSSSARTLLAADNK